MIRIYFFLAAISITGGARILGIAPMPSYSHQIFYQPIWRELALRGHDLVVLTTDPINDPSLTNLKEIDLHDVYSLWVKNFTKNAEKGMFRSLDALLRIVDALYGVFTWEIQHPDVQNLIKNETEHFDLVMVEQQGQIFNTFKHRFKCPLIGLASRDTFDHIHQIMGNPTHSLLYPDQVMGVNDPTFFQKMSNLLYEKYLQLIFTYYYPDRDATFVKKYFGSDFPSAHEIGKTMDLLFINVNPVFTYNRPLTPSTISLSGGMHIQKIKPLPKELAQFVDDAKEGIIYFSLGSNIKSKDISDKIRNVLLQVFSEIPYKVLWKFESEDLPGKPNNVKIMKWMPQQDLLRHPNVKLFITQGGIQSLEESLFSNVPMLGLPFSGDQFGNAKKIKEKGMGLWMDPRTMTVEGFKNTVLEIVHNSKYKERVKELADLVRDEPMSGLEKAVWWTEYVLRHNGSQHLKGAPPLPFHQQYYLDVLAFISGLSILCLCLAYFIIRKLVLTVRNLATKNKLKSA